MFDQPAEERAEPDGHDQDDRRRPEGDADGRRRVRRLLADEQHRDDGQEDGHRQVFEDEYAQHRRGLGPGAAEEPGDDARRRDVRDAAEDDRRQYVPAEQEPGGQTRGEVQQQVGGPGRQPGPQVPGQVVAGVFEAEEEQQQDDADLPADGDERLGQGERDQPAGAEGQPAEQVQGYGRHPDPDGRVVTSPKSTLQAAKGGITLDIPCDEGFAGTSQTQTDLEQFDAEAVFVGHGITAPEFGWNDYAGVDVRGKVVVLFTNEPPSADPAFFSGPALTYYGRWTFKFEEAARRGAKACFIIHTPETAGYPYAVVRPLDGAQLKREPGRPALAFAGWLSRKAGEQLLGLSGRTVDGALRAADAKGFKPVSLGITLKGYIPTQVRAMRSHNVVGVVEGSDPVLKAEAVVFTAHWDHLGVGRAVVGDAIYNGAADNATGCAMLLELARAWAARSPRPKRSAVFLAVTAEEKGLLGSKYYTQNPAVPLGKTALDLNFDMILPLGVPESVVVTGADRTTAGRRSGRRRSGTTSRSRPTSGRTWASSTGRTTSRWPGQGFRRSRLPRGCGSRAGRRTSPAGRCRRSTTRRTTRRRTKCGPTGTTRGSPCWPGSLSTWPAAWPTPTACRRRTPGTSSARPGKRVG